TTPAPTATEAVMATETLVVVMPPTLTAVPSLPRATETPTLTLTSAPPTETNTAVPPTATLTASATFTPSITPTFTPTATFTLPPAGLQGNQDMLELLPRLAADQIAWTAEQFLPGPRNEYWRLGVGG